jgi:predicted transcriptional regulator
MSEELTETEVQSFTSWKLDVIDAMACDPDLEDIDFRVAFRLMQHVNARTKDAHPSIERIAAQLGVHRDTVRRSIDRMCDETGNRHWLSRVRYSRTEPYVYSFVTERLNRVIDGKLAREDCARETSQERKRMRFEVARKQPREVARLQCPEVARVQSPEVAAVQPKHLRNNHLSGTPESSSRYEERNLSGNGYAKMKGRV